MKLPFDILYEDENLLAVDKPAGILVIPDRWDKNKRNLMHELRLALPGQYLANAHRLDRDTSGVFIVARSHKMLAAIAEQFRKKETEKTYVALVQGHLAEPEMTIDLPIGPHLGKPGLSVIAGVRGKPSQTRVRVAEKFQRHSLLKVMPLTGRSHQVRVHLKWVGCPIVADADYGSGEPLMLSDIKRRYKPAGVEKPLLARQALHAESLRIQHPVTGESMTIAAPWPKDFELAVKYLRKYALA